MTTLRLQQALIALGTLLVGIVLRAQYFGFVSNDYHYFLSNWMVHIRTHDLANTYGVAFNNYTPLYSYMLGFFDVCFHDLYSLYSIKLLSLVGELYAVYWVWRVMALHYQDKPGSLRPTVTVALFMLCPSVVTNASMTGQCDCWLIGFVLASLFYFMQRKNTTALVYAGVALAFKPQPVFLSPLLLIGILRRDVSWKQLWIIPAVYVVTCLPAWLEGRTMHDLLTIYWSQLNAHFVSYNAANPYYYLNGGDVPVIRQYGEAFAASVAGLLVWVSYKRWQSPLTPVNCLLLATLFSTVMPFVLPMMHDRYFFLADILSLMLACINLRWVALPVLLQAASLIAIPPRQLPRFHGLPGWVQSLGIYDAVWMNACSIAIILWLCWRHVWTKEAQNDSQVL